jgi:glycine betaine catabolism B
MIKSIDGFLNRITMYRLVLYYLLCLLAVAEGLSLLGVLPYPPLALPFTTAFLTLVCWGANKLFARTWGVPANAESAYISALILALIITPLGAVSDVWFLAWAAVWAMASKYIFAINKQHIFNPVAFAVALTALTVNQTASWWVGTVPMLPFVLVGALLAVRKTRRWDSVAAFVVAALVTTLALTIAEDSDLLKALQGLVLYSPLVFFAGVIVTEPLTAPPTKRLQTFYGVLVGVLFAPQVHLGQIYSTPELAILIGNVVFYVLSPRARWVLTLTQKIQIAPDVYEFIFTPHRPLSFAPGQYLEWTLGHERPDSRGNRRYFTLASAPTEDDLRVGVKFYPQSSTFKRSLLDMGANGKIVASQVAGDFILPSDPKQKCVLIAGGIGITPFRSMICYLLDTRQKRPLVLLYANSRAADIVYKDVFERAKRELGMRTIYTLTDKKKVSPVWTGRVGYIDAALIREQVPDYANCIFYVSGPNSMVDSTVARLQHMGIRGDRIKTDFFPGLA